jgi:galactokinase
MRGAGGGGTVIELTPEEHAMAVKFGLSDEEYFKHK